MTDSGSIALACRRCGRTIVRVGDRWSHVDSGYWLSCHAASYTGLGWDESIPKSWVADAPTGFDLVDHRPVLDERARREPSARSRWLIDCRSCGRQHEIEYGDRRWSPY